MTHMIRCHALAVYVQTCRAFGDATVSPAADCLQDNAMYSQLLAVGERWWCVSR